MKAVRFGTPSGNVWLASNAEDTVEKALRGEL